MSHYERAVNTGKRLWRKRTCCVMVEHLPDTLLAEGTVVLRFNAIVAEVVDLAG